MTKNSRTKVLIIDDSATVRSVLSDLINSQHDMEVMETASDPYVAVEQLKKEKPDVITLDIEMPRMDGITFLRKLMSQHPIPVVVVSSLSKKYCEVSVKALEYGAVEVFLKEDIKISNNQVSGYNLLLDKIRIASKSSVKKIATSLNTVQKAKYEEGKVQSSEKVIVIGSSTGGTVAINEILQKIPGNIPGIVIVQHMPKQFTKFFADRLNENLTLVVKEAEDGDSVLPGRVLIAPGGKHIKLRKIGTKTIVRVWDGPQVNHHRPSVDVLFHSAAEQLGPNSVGVLLTGMGKDGAEGLLAMRTEGAFTIAQDEETSVVYGMPGEAAKINAVDKILPIGDIPLELMRITVNAVT